MSESKKRSRKSKLEVRNDVDIEDTENTILQTLSHPSETHNPETSQLKSPPPLRRILDHTYARPHDNPTPSSSPALQLSVKVEVEEFDESIINDTCSPGPSIHRAPKLHFKDKQKSIHIFEVNLEKMYKISDHINWSSTNLADKYLSIELKNIWGRVLKPEDDDDPYNIAIQKALHGWGYSLVHGGLRSWRESPLFYQCHLCNLAWWYLTPFKDHIRIHDHTKIIISHQENYHESHIVASNTLINKCVHIPCEGNCYRCGNPYNFHVRPPKELYNCKRCHKTMETCSLTRQHKLDCTGNEAMFRTQKLHQCLICFTFFCTKDELDLHKITSHEVRSDIPSPFSFKSCSVCQKKYQYYFTHMCVKSSLSSSCMYCYRKFQTKTLQSVHYQTGNDEDFKCKICNEVLKAKCMETEHMLTHTDKFRMVYKCINFECPSNILFPDEQSIKMHKVLYHYQKYDKRRTYYEKMLIPEQCVKFDYIQVVDSASARGGIRITKTKGSQEPQALDWCVPSAPDKQTDMHTEEDDDLIIIKQELQEIEPIEIDSQDDSQDGPMDYAEMLSKVFKVSDTVQRPRLVSTEEIHTQIKLEPTDMDFESTIDFQEHPISIKQEPIETLGGSFDETCQTDAYQNSRNESLNISSRNDRQTEICQNSRNESCQSNSSLNISSRNDSCQTEASHNSRNESCQSNSSQSDSFRNDSCQTNTAHIQGGIKIKTEPKDFEIGGVFDSDITAIKMEPEDVKREMLECTEVVEYKDDNVITADAVSNTPETVNTKSVTKNPNSLLKSNAHKVVKCKPSTQNQKSLLKKNFANILLKNNRNQNKSDRQNHKSVLISNMKTNEESKKYDEQGLKIQKLYRCARCGYTANHKLFRIHQRSLCEVSPTEELSNKFLCSKCETSFGSLKTYLVHFTKHGYGVLHCPCCNMKFEMLKDLLPHFHKHVKLNYVNCWMINDELETTKKQHRCQTCRQIVPPEEFFPHWEAHLKLKVEKTELEELKICKEKVTETNKKVLQPTMLHLALHQLRSEGREKDCLVCYRKFSRRYDVKRHLIEHLLLDAYTKKDSTPTMMLRCQICLEEFFRPEQYKFHMREHGGLPVYRCDLCDKTFSDSSNFAKHKKIHNMRVLICDICQKKFHAKSALEKHIIMHMTTDPIKCDLCDRQFYEASQYNKHLHVTHMRPAKFRCIVCDISFDSLKKKWDHAWAVHKERKHKADCPICHKAFRKYQDVKNHAKYIHQVELSFYNIKSESGILNNVNLFCKIKKNKKQTSIVSAN